VEAKMKYKTNYPDLDGNLPGSEDYNVIGAQVRYANETTGIEHEYHPKRGVVPMNSIKKGANIAINLNRDQLNTELANAERLTE
jgi:hypothetical protein